jgi:hypothetical protein
VSPAESGAGLAGLGGGKLYGGMGSTKHLIRTTSKSHEASSWSTEQALGIDLSFQDFITELENFPVDYAPPRGRLRARDNDIVAG